MSYIQYKRNQKKNLAKNVINIYKNQSLVLQQIPTCTNKIPIPYANIVKPSK